MNENLNRKEINNNHNYNNAVALLPVPSLVFNRMDAQPSSQQQRTQQEEEKEEVAHHQTGHHTRHKYCQYQYQYEAKYGRKYDQSLSSIDKAVDIQLSLGTTPDSKAQSAAKHVSWQKEMMN